jgi:hypothetical protein
MPNDQLVKELLAAAKALANDAKNTKAGGDTSAKYALAAKTLVEAADVAQGVQVELED